MNIHLVYPVNKKKISAPWSTGNNLYNYLSKFFKVKVYQWTSFEKIDPDDGDILIGHAHPNPLTCFRRSMLSNKWGKKILLQPYNGDPYQMSYLYKIVQYCDFFIAITGKYWFESIKYTIFKTWKEKIIRLDMAIDTLHFPRVKNQFNKIGERKFLYIGNDYRFNNFSKNIQFLEKIITKYDHKLFSTIGNKSIKNVTHYGWLDFKNKNTKKIILDHDFLIMTSNHDANPTTILESMSWGLIPVVTKECGYYKEKGIFNIPLNQTENSIKILEKLQFMKNSKLKKISDLNYRSIIKKYNWDIINKKVYKIIISKKKIKILKYNKKEIQLFEHYAKLSLNNPMRFYNICSFIKTSIKFILMKILTLFKKPIVI